MHNEELNWLARHLEVASKSELDRADRPLFRQIKKLAREDLYATLRVWQSYANAQIKESGCCPEILIVAVVIEKNFEGRAKQSRGAIAVPGNPGAVVTRPEADRVYQGRVIAQTPDYFVQKTCDAYVLHERESLTLDPSSIGDDVKIRYPFEVLNGLGVVIENEQGMSQE